MRRIFALPSEIFSVIASKQASSLPTVLIYAAISFSLGFLGLLAEPAKSIYDFPYLDLIVLPSIVVLTASANRFVLTRISDRNKATATIAAWFLAALVSMSVALGAIFLLTATPIPQHRVESFVFDVISIFVNIASYSIVIASIARYRASAKVLKQQLSNLALLREGLSTQISRARERYKSQVRGEIEPVLNQIAQAIEASDASSVMRKARSAIEQVVLPLNLRIDSQPVELQDLPNLPSTASTKITLREVFNQRIAAYSLFLPVTTLVIFAASLLGAFVYIFGQRGLAVGFITMATLFALQVLTIVLFRDLSLKLAAAVTTLVAVSALLSVASVLVGFSVLPSANREEIQFVQLGIFIALFAIGIFQIAIVTANSHLERVSKSNDEYAHLLRTRDSNLRALRLRISQAIHGDIQGKLRAVLLRVNTGGITNENISLLSKDLQHIEAVLEDIGVDLPIEFEEELKSLKEFWSGVCEIEFEHISEFTGALQINAGQAKLALEVVAEAIANAVKHADAKSAWVSFGLQDSALSITVKNPSAQPQNVSLSTGVGSRRFSELCRSWSLKQVDGTTVFEAQL